MRSFLFASDYMARLIDLTGHTYNDWIQISQLNYLAIFKNNLLDSWLQVFIILSLLLTMLYAHDWYYFLNNQILIIGGGIANFTNVAATFKGIVKALLQFQAKLVEHNVSIFVRRAGPNYQEGLRYTSTINRPFTLQFFKWIFKMQHTFVESKGKKRKRNPQDFYQKI